MVIVAAVEVAVVAVVIVVVVVKVVVVLHPQCVEAHELGGDIDVAVVGNVGQLQDVGGVDILQQRGTLDRISVIKTTTPPGPLHSFSFVLLHSVIPSLRHFSFTSPPKTTLRLFILTASPSITSPPRLNYHFSLVFPKKRRPPSFSLSITHPLRHLRVHRVGGVGDVGVPHDLHRLALRDKFQLLGVKGHHRISAKFPDLV
ncbi:hypothetical protein E2C01_061346 [Portunus trituberculatus]|uniref:Uncharacterized protein n=1 Tax=Portunus trituberculatus TaxID=210409 RepID=A0A5B7HBE8_PORTR|nr:hypothetical protein [Portunus trituberculatus]